MSRSAHLVALVGAVVICGGVVAWWTVRPQASSAADARLACGGKDRWSVKTASDADAPAIDAKHPKLRTIDWLVSQTHDPIHKATPRIRPFETTIFVVRNVTLVEAKREEDGDIHLVIRDD